MGQVGHDCDVADYYRLSKGLRNGHHHGEENEREGEGQEEGQRVLVAEVDSVVTSVLLAASHPKQTIDLVGGLVDGL